jgi:4-amino-4-deoxy-L-arabinose transferase-like glycosyltransferase
LQTVPAPVSASHSNEHQQSSWTWPGLFFALIALVGCAFAFVGLARNSFWADELYTLQIVDNQGGVAEVFRRVLADDHPPLYYFILYGWTLLAGTGESAARLPSAVYAVLALAAFAWGTRKRLSPSAIAFACATATTSMFWFAQSQNLRDYPLAILLSAILLAVAIRLDHRYRTSTRFPLVDWLLLIVLSIAGSQTHPYMLLMVGVLLIFLMLSARTWRLRLAIAALGMVILALYIGLLWLMLHETGRHGFDGTWFSNKPKFLLSQLRRTLLNFLNRQSLLIIVIMLLTWWLRSRRGLGQSSPSDENDIRWTTALCWFVFLGVIVSGVAVSLLIAPSFSYRNVLVCAPFGWFLVGRLYDVAPPNPGKRYGTWLAIAAIVLVGSQLVVLMRGRMLPDNEPWRASAAYVQGFSGCNNNLIRVVVLPGVYDSTMTAAVHRIVEHDYFGYYLPPSYRLRAYLPEELLQVFAHTVQPGEATSNSCPVVAWTLHGIDNEAKALELAEQLASTPGFSGKAVDMQEFVAYQLRRLDWKPEPSGFVYLQATLETLRAGAALPAGKDIDRKHSVGDLLWVTDVTPSQDNKAGVRVYAIQRWREGNMVGETRITRALPLTSNQ